MKVFLLSPLISEPISLTPSSFCIRQIKLRVDWVTMDEEEEDGEDYNSMGLSGSSEAPF
jgi:hypothetical protein